MFQLLMRVNTYIFNNKNYFTDTVYIMNNRKVMQFVENVSIVKSLICVQSETYHFYYHITVHRIVDLRWIVWSADGGFEVQQFRWPSVTCFQIVAL